jgi:diadenosine tetraphosphate (Ap4A) HIT family hydrolase
MMGIDELLRQLRNDIVKADHTVQGFNVGINIGTVAGQTIHHCHVHLIPRRSGDVPDPWGGVRAIKSFPAKHIIRLRISLERTASESDSTEYFQRKAEAIDDALRLH